MMEWTNNHFRTLARLISKHAWLYTEMIAAETIIYQSGDLDRFLAFTPEQHPIVLQIGGSNLENLAKATQLARPYGYDEINFKKFVAKAMSVIAANSDVPVSVKCRIGVDNHDTYSELCDFIYKVFTESPTRHFVIHSPKAFLKGPSPANNRKIPPLNFEFYYALLRNFPDLRFTINGGINSVDDIAAKINKIIRDSELKELGQLEQDLVFGDAGTKEVINFLRTKPDVTSDNKLRLLMIYAAIYGDKLEGDKLKKLMELAKLSLEDMNAVDNMRMLDGSSDTKNTSMRPFTLKFNMNKKKSSIRKDRPREEVKWQLSRFYPVVEELIEKVSKGELSSTDFSCMNDPSPTFHGTSSAAAATLIQPQDAHSVRSRRTGTWARPRHSEDGYSSDSSLRHAVTDSLLRHTSSDFRKMGQRIFVFIIGGVTRSEKLKMLSDDEISIDDIEI